MKLPMDIFNGLLDNFGNALGFLDTMPNSESGPVLHIMLITDNVMSYDNIS